MANFSVAPEIARKEHFELARIRVSICTYQPHDYLPVRNEYLVRFAPQGEREKPVASLLDITVQAGDPADQPDHLILLDGEKLRAGLSPIGGYRLKCNAYSAFKEVIWIADTDPKITAVRFYHRLLLPSTPDKVARIPNPADTILIQVLMSLRLAVHGTGALHHATAAMRDGKCFLFPARSGTGKSTLASLLNESGEFRVLGDDRIFTRKAASGFSVHASPWVSTSRLCENLSGPLEGMIFLRQAPKTQLTKITKAEALQWLLPVTDIPWWEQAATNSILGYLEELISTVPAYILDFTPTPDVADVLARELG